MKRGRLRRIGALLVGLVLIAAGCKSDDNAVPPTDALTTIEASSPAATETPSTTEATSPTITTVVSSGDGELQGFKGTTPAAQLTDDFKARLLALDPTLSESRGSAEAYDVTTIIALAAELAQDDGIAYAGQIHGITRDGEKCTDFASCKAIIDADHDPDYDGLSGPITLNGYGDPIEASYKVEIMGANDRVDDSLTTYVSVRAAPDADVPVVPVEAARDGDGELKIGTLLPMSGSLAALGAAEIAGVGLAILDINAAGGVLGRDVIVIEGDSGDSVEIANRTVDRLLDQEVDAVIGAAASAMSLAVIDTITDAGVVQFSPSNLSDTLTTYDDHGLFFRTSPPDLLQGTAIGQLMAGDGATSVAIIARDDAYGHGLANMIEQTLTEAELEVVLVKFYPPDAAIFDTEIAEIVDAAPNAIAVIGFEESSKILRTMVDNGIGPQDVATYGCDGNIGDLLGENYDAGL